MSIQVKLGEFNVIQYLKPGGFSVTTADTDSDSSGRTADAMMHRDRIAVKKQIDLEFRLLKWDEISAILQAVEDIFVDVCYPDPKSGQYETRTFYAGNRTVAVPFEKNGEIYWDGLKFTLTER